MPVSYITYELQNGYIHHWLVAGPQTLTVDNPDTLFSADATLRFAQRYRTENAGVTRQPVEPGPLPEADFTPGDSATGNLAGSDYTGRWAYTTCAEDHFVDGDSLLAFEDSSGRARNVAGRASHWSATDAVITRHPPRSLYSVSWRTRPG